ncbi:tetratricopeptide repeat protein [Streptomyces phyllanthi]|uniref:Uncharacterized protein n=1 Tax=Streptomyces phyllanthi TaxID=1803180 RepID=A0A5N8VZU9_9ACTN|nr:hypothetical protein [Streptomyces phyllanthi]MPY40780.1 hypothetical protein [Streptomyces phyllanthi]
MRNALTPDTWVLMQSVLRKEPSQPDDTNVGKDVSQGGFEPCLLALVRVLASLGATDDRLRWPPPDPVTALVEAGHLTRAVELTLAIGNEEKRWEALRALAETVVDSGDLAAALAVSDLIGPPVPRAGARAAVALRLARAGEPDSAATLAGALRYPHLRTLTWAELAKTAATAGDSRALVLLDRAEKLLPEAMHEDWTATALINLVEAATAMGDHDRAEALADRAEDFVRSGRVRMETCSRGPQTKGSAWNSDSARRVLARVLAVEARRADFDRIDALLATGPLDAEAMAELLEEAADTVSHEVALALADRAETLLDSHRDPRDGTGLRPALAELLARHGHADRAEAHARSLEPPPARDRVLFNVARGLARSGDTVRAVALARSLANPVAGDLALFSGVDQLLQDGDTDSAGALARSLRDPTTRDMALSHVVRQLAQAGDTVRAEALGRSLTDPHWRGTALLTVVERLAGDGDTESAQELALSLTHRPSQAAALIALGRSLSPDHARRLAARAVRLDGWEWILNVLPIMPGSVTAIAEQVRP